ncbi:MAG: flagellar assembly protein FliH [Sulfurimicrobium sp.]|jgi:flagellar assembly protein FliH|nr:flagellar assembly protein FliH [Sulfurimicrobium sp.]MDP2963171.1 flagellar assembly protein FliH [Sulfurimicrobium sp.]MDZ7654624.1 flagellar assembly protein FliH [Sulfurimicrobium sp.]
MSNIIPKEQLSAYQRWEMDAFEDVRPGDGGADNSQVPLPTAEAIELMHQQARQEGYSEGLEQGREQGYREGREQAGREAQRLNDLVSQVNGSLQQLDQAMSQDLLDLALGIAHQMLRQALEVRPELVLAVVKDAINSFPQANQHPQLILHPQDAALVRSCLEAELAHGHWRVVEDAQIEPGGCRLETAHGELDATLERRWQNVLKSLGQNGDWLAPK